MWCWALHLRNLCIGVVGNSRIHSQQREVGAEASLLLHPGWQPQRMAGCCSHTHTPIRKTFPSLFFPCSLRVHGQASSRDLIKKNVFLHIGGGPWQDSPGRWKANEGNESNCQWLKALVWYSPSDEWGWGPESPDRKAWPSWAHKSCAVQQRAAKCRWLLSTHTMKPTDGAQLVESQPSMW